MSLISGVDMNDTSHVRLEIAEVGEAILGNNLLGLQVGNEPDLYGRHVYTIFMLFSKVAEYELGSSAAG